MELKDLIWNELSKDIDRHMTLTHRPMEIDSPLDDEEIDFIDDEDEEYDIEVDWEEE